MKCATYLRVSTSDQDLAPQRIELAAQMKARGWEHALECSDVISGGKVSREGLDRLLAGVEAGEFEAVLVVKIDRLARSLTHFAQLIEFFREHEIALIIPGQGIDTSKANPAGDLQMNVLAAVAQFERSIISERTKAGLVAARARGKVLGKPSAVLVPNWRAVVGAWEAETGGFDFRLLAERLGGVSKSTAHRLARKVEREAAAGVVVV